MKKRLAFGMGLVLRFALVFSLLASEAVSLRSTTWPATFSIGSAEPKDGRANPAATPPRDLFAPRSHKMRRVRASNDKTSVSSPGQSATLLPDGRWLIIGGEGPDGPLATAAVKDRRTGTVTSLPGGLQQPRAWHTATLLPDGTVLILGGIGVDGQVVDSVELFDPTTQDFKVLPPTGLAPRAHHSATLLTEGRVLIAGGVDGIGETLGKLELWDPRAKPASALPQGLLMPRRKHTATLMANGSVRLWGGEDRNGAALSYGEVFDPETQGIRMETSPIQPSTQPPRLAASLPEDGAINVPLDVVIALRFSEPLRVETVNVTTLTLQAPQGAVAAKVIPAEAGMLAFITPQSPLLAGTSYTLALVDPTDEAGRRLPDTTVTFTTPGTSASAGVTGQAPPSEPEGATGVPVQPVPPLLAPLGVTAVSGRVLKLNGDPLANVTINIETRTTRTDGTGRFLVAPLTSGHHVMFVDGRSASVPGTTYGVFELGVDLLPGRTNVLYYYIWMPALDMAHAVIIPSPTPTEIVITTPAIPNLELRIPAQTIVRDHEGRAVQQISITPIPVSRPPFPLAKGVDVPIYFTIQPGGGYIQNPNRVGARLIYPNVRNAPPGRRFDFWNYDPDARGWYVYGQGTVTADGRQIVPDLGVVVYEFTGAMVAPPSQAPPTGPPPGKTPKGGDPVDLSTGLFVLESTDFFLQDVLPISFTRTYRQNDRTNVIRPFGIGTTHPYEIFLVGDVFPPAYTYQELILPDGGRVHYDRISPGTGFADALYQHTSSPTAFYGSTISWNGNAWDLKLKDGTTYTFPDGIGARGPQQAALLSIRDRYGNTVSCIREAATGNLLRIVSPNGRWIEFTYDAPPNANRITRATDNIGRSVRYEYDPQGRLNKVTDAKGGVTEYTYDPTFPRMLTIKDPRLIIYLTNQYDGDGRVWRQTQVDGGIFQFDYELDTDGNVTKTLVTDPLGSKRHLTFTTPDPFARGRYRPPGYVATDTRAYTPPPNPPLPEQQTYTYERDLATNFLLSVTDPVGHITRYTYYPSGGVESITTLADDATAAATTHFTYEPNFNQLATITDPLGHITTFFYYANGSLQKVRDALQNETSFTNNPSGQPTTITDPLQNPPTQLSYDAGDLASITDPLNRTTTFFTDAAGRQVAVTNPLNQTTRYQYDPMDQVTQITDPLTGSTQFGYDLNGNLRSVTDARQNLTRYDYDNMDRLIARTDPLLHSERYDEYDLAGNLKQFTDRRGKVSSFDYDALNRLKFAGFGRIAGPPVTYESTIDYAYDGLNRLTQASDSLGGSVTRTYNDLARTMVETTPQGSVAYVYDEAARTRSMTVGGQATVNYGYDNANRLRTITQGASTVQLGYDNDSRRQTLTLPNGIVVTYGYDVASLLRSLSYQLGTTTLGNLTYGYDPAGRRSSMGGAFARTQLPPAVATTAYNAANQLTQWGTATLTYDLNGNLTGDGTNIYTWDARNQLAAISGPAAATFQYDAFGRRTSKTVSSEETRFLYDGVNPVQELQWQPSPPAWVPLANLLTGLGVDEYFTRTDTLGERMLLTDALGSTVALTDTSGTVLNRYTYEPFGNASVDGSVFNPYQYTGRENDATGLFYYRARYYSPSVQRFISEDPIEFDGGINLYAYVGDDPINFADPLGLGKKPRSRPGKPRPPCPPTPPKPQSPPPPKPPQPPTPPPKPPDRPKPRDCQNGLSNCAREAGIVLLACFAGVGITTGSVLGGCVLDCAFSGAGFPACAAGCLALTGAIDFALGEFCLGMTGLVFGACSAQYLSRCY